MESNHLRLPYKSNALPMSYGPVVFLFIALITNFDYSLLTNCTARVAQWLEHHIDIVGAEGSIPSTRTIYPPLYTGLIYTPVLA